MRFDDRLATVLAQPEPDQAALVAKWRQVLDLIAQQGGREPTPEIQLALTFLRERRDEVPAALRRQFLAALPRVGPMLAEIVEEAGEREPPRRPPPVLPAAQDSQSHIRNLIARIERLRQARERERSGEEAKTPARAFRWETGPDGTMGWIEGAPRGPLVGQSIASASQPAFFGVDGQAAGAFARRSAFRDARFRVAGEGGAAGDWRISGVPYFDPGHGHFLGYRGSARRPRVDEDAAVTTADRDVAGLFGTELQPDSLRQLIHELRTPLNAILGFAEMIDGQFLGPASESYRSRAQQIHGQAAVLLSAVDDLDTAARIETSRFPLEESTADAVTLLSGLYLDYEPVARQRNASLMLDIQPDLPQVRVERDAVERMFARMLAATIGLAARGESLSAVMSLDSGRLSLAITRPGSIAGLAERELLDPGYSPEGDWPAAPALGLGFALRLVRNIAEAVGGELRIERDRFLLLLPVSTNGRNGRQRG